LWSEKRNPRSTPSTATISTFGETTKPSMTVV